MASQTEDYTSWSNTDLIERLTHLEARLRAQNAKHTPSPSPLKRKPKKPSKQFNPDKYHTRLIALKFAYLGANYNGFEYHSNNFTPLPTIEEELWKALKKTRLIFPTHKEGQSENEVSWEGCDYSKCGRTDRGVSAFGQVIGLRVRSARPKKEAHQREDSGSEDESGGEVPAFDPVRDELPYMQLINRVLPPDIRILAWCPDPPENFSARFNCKERRYRYFFTNPAYVPLPTSQASGSGEGWLDVEAMNEAAKKYEGLHDFRNLCKVDPSKQLTSFERRIFHAGIHEVRPAGETGTVDQTSPPRWFYFEVRGSAFLWHQVRHLVAVLFLVGQGYETPSIVDELLDVQKTPGRPLYDMANDTPLVLWDCIFPDPDQLDLADHASSSPASTTGYEDGLKWIYIGDAVGGREQSKEWTTGLKDGMYGRNGMMDELWALWRKRKMDEVLSWSLMDVVSGQGQQSKILQPEASSNGSVFGRVFDGSETPRTVGTYVPVLQRERLEIPEVVNARYALRKGLDVGRKSKEEDDADE